MNGLKKVHFIGVGGVGMSALAGILLQKGLQVSGSDLVKNHKIEKLEELGLKFFAGHAAENLTDGVDLTVFSSAVSSVNPELLRAEKLHIPIIRRGDFLAHLGMEYRRVISVSGSHGKTSITAMIVHILKKLNLHPGYLIGGEPLGFEAFDVGNSDIFVTEADESDGTHRLLHSKIGVVSNIDDDHSWSVGGVEKLHENFKTFCRQCEKVILPESEMHFFSSDAADFLSITSDELNEFDFLTGFQKINGALALQAVRALGIEVSAELLQDYAGVRRRMTKYQSKGKYALIEDYAHHPTEVASSIEYLRKSYPDYHLRMVFQPHRYARLKKYFPEFVQILGRADSLYVVPVFAAWNESGSPGSRELAQSVPGAVYSESSFSELASQIVDYHDDKPLLIAIVGAGDVNLILNFL